MALEFLLPDIGEGLVEAIVLRWLVPVGEEVAADQPVAELETDKAVVEMPAPRAGVVLFHGAAEGDTIGVGRLLVVIGERGEQWDSSTVTAADARPAPAAPVVGTLREEPELGGGFLALPAVRRLADELSVDLATVTGTGPGGRITRADVEAATSSSRERGPVERIRLSATRQSIARHLTRSWQEIPHVVTYADADAGPLLDARERHIEEVGGPAPLEALLIHAVTPVLADYPEFNASLEGSDLLLRRHYDIGFAVDTPDGLMVAVVRGADRLDVPALAERVAALAGEARDRTIAGEDVRGATFTISNIGAVGGGYGTPIIPYGTTAILSVGRATRQPVVVGDEVAVARLLPLSLSYDHRVIDGATGRRFMASVVAALEGIGGA